jgi:hypothetical protein
LGKKERSLLPDAVDLKELKRILKKWDGRLWTGFIWLRIGTSGGLLRTDY